MTDNFDQQFDNAKKNIDEKNSAHFVYYEIKKLGDHPERWIWELLQNAHDARGADGIITEIRHNAKEKKLIFLHNGRGFKADEIVHLIKAGTTKDEDDQETHGKFGRGFLTTHLLSPTVEIAGQLADGRSFDFTLERNNKTKDTLLESLKGSLADFDKSKSNNKPAIPKGFTTQFMFPIRDPDAEKAVIAGLNTLEQCAPYVVVFNREFFSINIKRPDRTKCFRRDGNSKLDASGIQQVTVAENDTKREYLLAENKQQRTSVAVRMESKEKQVCLQLDENIPKLFSAFPLVATKSYSFPAVINSPKFFLPPDRDRVLFNKNQDVFEEACNLLIKLIERAALEGWDHIHQWANFLNTEHLSQQMGTEWETCIKNLMNRIDQTPAVHTLSGELKSPFESILPWIETEKSENVVALWDLLKDRQEFREDLPRRDEAIGWYNTIKSWKIDEHAPFNGLRLAEDIQSCCYLKYLQLLEGVCAVEWLDRFYDFLKKDELFNDATHDYSFVPNQIGEFQKLSSLSRDKDIDEELKDIDHILGRNIRERLRHTSLISLEDVNNTNSLDNADILGDLIDGLKSNADDLIGGLKNDTDENNRFKEASVRLFAWIVRNKQYIHLPSFTVFAEGSNSEKLDIIRLPFPKPDDEPDMEIPLAPTRAWNDDLQKYSELFPRRHILANDFYDAVSEEKIWQKLDERKIVRKDVIIRHRGKVSFEEFQPHDPLTKEDEHESKEKITVSNIAFLTKESIGIIEKVRKNRSLAYKFWCFLTEWLVVHDSKGVEIIEDVLCTCDDTHRCYPAQWLKPVVDRKWVARDEKNKADRVEAEVLVNLLRDFDPKRIGSQHNDHIGKLLEAIGISELDFIRETLVDKNDHEAVDNAMKEILIKADGNVKHFNQAIKYIEAITSSENLSEHVEELLEADEDEVSQAREILHHVQEDNELFLQEFEKSKDRADTINENRKVGERVEMLVKQILEETFPNEKFKVKSVREGAKIEGADIEIVELEVTQGKEKLWIEVKSTRSESNPQRVKMEPSQGKKAVEKKDNFLLCVVPIPKGSETDMETVKENMRFIANIGDKVASLCDNLDELEELREGITADTPSGVRLDVEKTKAGILVKKSVWEKNGFRLEKLAEHLKRVLPSEI